MNWKYVFNTVGKDKPWYGHISRAARAAHKAGYKFMAFNGIIYFLLPSDFRVETHDTNLRVKIINGRRKIV